LCLYAAEAEIFIYGCK
jgi:hypothetical protein